MFKTEEKSITQEKTSQAKVINNTGWDDVGLFAGYKIRLGLLGRHQAVINGLPAEAGVKLDQFASYS